MTTVTAAVAEETPSPATRIYPAWHLAWYGMFVFFLAQIVSTVDRGILNLVVDPVARDIGASEIQVGLLQGMAFATFYVLIGVPLGLVADRVSRRRLLIAGILIWSLATVFGGFVHDFRSMFFSRLFVGMGEATLGPCAISMLSDMFPPSRRGGPMALYMLGGAVSSGVAYLISGAVLAAAPTGVFDIIPLLQRLQAWRICFVICGSMGFGLAALIFLFREPKRRGVTLRPAGSWGIRSAAQYLRENWTVFAPFYGSVAAYTMGVGGIGWGAAYIIRRFGLTPANVGKQLGSYNIIGAVIGSLLAMLIVDSVMLRAGVRGKLRLAPYLPLIALPCSLAVLVHSPALAMMLLAVPMFALPIYGSVMLSCTVELVPANMRSVAVSFYSLAITMVGTGLGPLAVATVTQYVFKNPAMVGWSIMLVAPPLLLLASGLMLLSRRNALRALEASTSFTSVFEAVKG